MRSRAKGRIGLGFAVGMALAGGAWAAEAPVAPDARLKASVLMAMGDADLACQVLTQAYGRNPADSDASFLMGQCQSAQGHHREAVGHYERMLAANPDLMRVRLELARSYAELGERDKAKQHFRMVLDSRPPTTVETNIRRYLAALEAGKPWSVELATGHIFDTNVNTGPGSRDITAFGLPMVLDDTSTGKRSHGWTTRASGRYVHAFDKDNAWTVDGSLSRVDYEDIDQDLESVGASTGPLLAVADGIRLALPVTVSYARLGGHGYSHQYGLAPRLNLAIANDVTAELSGGLAYQNYYETGEKSGVVSSGQVGATWVVTEKLALMPAVSVRHENTHSDWYNNTALGPQIAASAALTPTVSLYARQSYQAVRYGEAEASANGATRNDKRYTTDLTLSWDLGEYTVEGLGLQVGYTFTRNQSNIQLYDYSRHQVASEVVYRF